MMANRNGMATPRWQLGLSILALLAVASSVGSNGEPWWPHDRDSESAINTHTAGRQHSPLVTSTANGFFVVWQSDDDGGDGTASLQGSVFGRSLDIFGEPLAGETILIGVGVTVEMHSAVEGPVTWLASGAVQIDGTIDLNGEDGHNEIQTRRRAVPGAGGYSGGAGSGPADTAPEAGAGPGGGQAPPDAGSDGGSAGHVNAGSNGPTAGSAYGHPALLPLVGGSGGGGGYNFSSPGPGATGFGGGAGGGALLVASSDSITVDGTISADAGCMTDMAGNGSGGAIRLVAPTLAGPGTLSADSDSLCSQPGSSSYGRIRLEAVQNQLSGTIVPAASVSLPGIVAIPAAELPLRVVAVGGISVPADPRGAFTPPDVVVTTTGPVTVDIEGRGIPLGTTVNDSMFLENGDVVTVISTPLAGTVALSTATASVTIPAGFVSFFVEANWTP